MERRIVSNQFTNIKKSREGADNLHSLVPTLVLSFRAQATSLSSEVLYSALNHCRVQRNRAYLKQVYAELTDTEVSKPSLQHLENDIIL